jgi:hypothetical protein
MAEKLPSLYDQLGAVLAAPILFFVLVAIIAWAAWRAWQWRFKAVFEKQKELYDLSRLEVDHWKTNAERTAKKLAEKIDLLQNLTTETKKSLGSAREMVLALTSQLNRLGQANSCAHRSNWSFAGKPVGNPASANDSSSGSGKPAMIALNTAGIVLKVPRSRSTSSAPTRIRTYGLFS